MSLATLRFAPWHEKSKLSPSRYASLTAAVSRVLHHVVSIPNNKFEVAWARAFVGSYAHDDALNALQALDDEPKDTIKLTSHEATIRKLTLELAERLAKVRGGLDASILVDLAVAYGTGNLSTLKTIFEDVCANTPSIAQDVKADVVPAFTGNLRDVHHRVSPSSRKVAYVLSQLLNCGPSIIAPFIQDKGFVLTLAECYNIGLDNAASSRGGTRIDASDSQRDWLYTKIGLIDTFHAVIQTLLQSKLSQDKDRLFELLFAILELPSSSTSDRTSSIPFTTQPLIFDYQYAFNLSGALSDSFQGCDDARVDLLVKTLTDLSPSPHGAKPSGGLFTILKDGGRIRRIVPTTKYKGKTKATNQQSESDAAFELALSQVLDIFPSHKPEYIRRCLEHAAFSGNHEKLISSLLEGTLPPGLAENAEVVSEVPQVENFEYTKSRQNIWDEDTMDFSRLRIGKARNDADAILQDRSFIEEMKADIIRRVEELSDEEDVGADRLRKQVVTFEEELDDGLEELAEVGVKVAGDGEASDDTDEEDDTGETIVPEHILELAYLGNPKLFERDSATRRSQARADLKLKTGWGDEQIEGWRIMLERNPKKDKILQKHEFSGNIPLAATVNAESGSSGTSRGASSHRGRGGDGKGRGRGRGGSRGGDGDPARDRAWKDKNKARNANHNRKRGHDKKMTRGGTPIL